MRFPDGAEGSESTGSVAGLDLPAVQSWFEQVMPDVGPLRAQLLHGGRSNLTYRLTDGAGQWVLRRPPLGALTPSAHDMGREYRVVAALNGSDVPVARAVGECTDLAVLGVPFTMVEYVDGRTIRTRTDLAQLPDHDVARCAFSLVEVLARLHAVEPGAVGLHDFGQPRGYLARQIRRWHDQWTRVATRELADLERLHTLLERECPPERGAAIVHGDFRIDNAILDADDAATVRALVDWEMATLGDPLADLGLHLAYADPAFDPALGGNAAATSQRMPDPADLAARYAAVTGRDQDELADTMQFYLGLGYFKAAVIAEGIHARHLRRETVGVGFDVAGNAVAPLAAAGIATLHANSAGGHDHNPIPNRWTNPQKVTDTTGETDAQQSSPPPRADGLCAGG
jgi:aminoglycoside phosphotransferase (APT) family kinase protein